MMFCPNCGTQCPDGERFCPSCGTALEQSQPALELDVTPEEPAARERKRVERKAPKLSPKLIGAAAVALAAVVVIVLAVIYLTRETKLGRSVFAVGGNEEAANASGINVNAVKMKVYAINGLLTGIAATIWLSRVNSAMPNGGVSYEFDAMIATIVGGTSFSGGVGSAVGTVIGAFIVGFLNNIMNLMGIDSYLQQVVRGVIIGGAVIWDIYFKNRKSSR